MSNVFARHLAVGLLLALAGAAGAVPRISLTVLAEKEVTVIDEDTGQPVARRIEASDTAPGDVLFYTIRYRNDGDEAAHNVRLDNPVPAGTTYLPGSAWGDDAGIQLSRDGGATFADAGNSDTRNEPAADPTHPAAVLRWRSTAR